MPFDRPTYGYAAGNPRPIPGNNPAIGYTILTNEGTPRLTIGFDASWAEHQERLIATMPRGHTAHYSGPNVLRMRRALEWEDADAFMAALHDALPDGWTAVRVFLRRE